MKQRTITIIEAALVAAIVGGFLLVWCSHADACTPDLSRGKVCPEDIPAVYVGVCDDGCYLVHPMDLTKMEKSRELVPKLRSIVDDLRLEVGTLQRQRDDATGAAVRLGDEVDLKLADLIEAQADLAAAPSWSTVFLVGVGGAVVGGIAAVVLLVAL